MPVVVVETDFRQPPPTASLLASPTSRTMSPDAVSEAASIAMREVSGSSSNHRESPIEGADNLGDSTFINGSSASNGLLHPWNGTVPDISRSPSVGDTFVSAAASSDLPYPSSFSDDSTDDSESGPDEEVVDLPEKISTFAYITTATITLSGTNNPADVTGSGANPPIHPAGANRFGSTGPVLARESTPDTLLQQGALSPGQGPSSSSATTSISVSIASGGE
uniref:Uncharacterized protein n=1 Tax=Anopheles maculatus TaxID=74869 RepID=A0A182T5K5_9DIPT